MFNHLRVESGQLSCIEPFFRVSESFVFSAIFAVFCDNEIATSQTLSFQTLFGQQNIFTAYYKN